MWCSPAKRHRTVANPWRALSPTLGAPADESGHVPDTPVRRSDAEVRAIGLGESVAPTSPPWRLWLRHEQRYCDSINYSTSPGERQFVAALLAISGKPTVSLGVPLAGNNDTGIFELGAVLKGRTSLRELRAGNAGRFSTNLDFATSDVDAGELQLDNAKFVCCPYLLNRFRSPLWLNSSPTTFS